VKRQAVLLAMLLALSASTMAAAPVYQASAQMRDTGYVLGDFLQQRVDIRVPPGAKLAADSVPRLGRVNNWMELRDAHITQRGDVYTLQMRYQMFGAVASAQQLAVPGFQLRFTGASPATVTIAPQPFYASPVLPASLDDQDREPRATPKPDPIASRFWKTSTAASVIIALLSAVYLGWIYDRLPWLPRKPGPLAALFRTLRRRNNKTFDAATYRDLLQRLHAALNRSAGQTLYVDNLAQLYARAPYLQPLQQEIEALFQHSRALFYDAAANSEAWPATRVIELCRHARDCERGIR
jgi:mxaA protein